MRRKQLFFVLTVVIGGFLHFMRRLQTRQRSYFNFGGSNPTQSGTEANPYTTVAQFTSNMVAGGYGVCHRKRQHDVVDQLGGHFERADNHCAMVWPADLKCDCDRRFRHDAK